MIFAIFFRHMRHFHIFAALLMLAFDAAIFAEFQRLPRRLLPFIFAADISSPLPLRQLPLCRQPRYAFERSLSLRHTISPGFSLR